MCLANISEDFTLNNMKKSGLKGSVKVHSVDYNAIDTSDISEYYETMFGFIKKRYMGLLTIIVNASNHKKCVSLYNQQCMIQPTLISLHPNEYTQGLLYYPFAVNLDR